MHRWTWRRNFIFWAGISWFACPEWGRAYMTPKKSLIDLITKDETPTELGVADNVHSQLVVNGANTAVNVGSQVDATAFAVVAEVTPKAVDVATNTLVDASADPTSLLQGM